jgi:hypothetical protein
LPGAPASLVAQARASFAIAIHAGGSTGVHARQAFVDGINTGLLYAAGAAILAALSVAILLRRKGQSNRRVNADDADVFEAGSSETAPPPSSHSIAIADAAPETSYTTIVEHSFGGSSRELTS